MNNWGFSVLRLQGKSERSSFVVEDLSSSSKETSFRSANPERTQTPTSGDHPFLRRPKA
jgi:hypothetical protein